MLMSLQSNVATSTTCVSIRGAVVDTCRKLS